MHGILQDVAATWQRSVVTYRQLAPQSKSETTICGWKALQRAEELAALPHTLGD